ncbi:hypothetical protein [Leptolyngbya iicbica]|nr:hypothetical protein [Leptolyngbya sp. LK]
MIQTVDRLPDCMTDSSSTSVPAYEKLKTLRPLMLRLHKALLEAEQDSYERVHGPITSKMELFQLVISDEWFDWLRPISGFIARIDESIASKEPVSPNVIHGLLEEAYDILPLQSDEASEAAVRYQRAVDNYPKIATLHAQVMDALKSSSTDTNGAS